VTLPLMAGVALLGAGLAKGASSGFD